LATDQPGERRRLRVLAVAASTHPDRGSEPGLGWGWIEALAAYHEMWVITGEREGNREAIERRLAEIPDVAQHIHLHFIPRPDGPWLERVFPPYYYRLYRQWHMAAFDLAKRLAAQVPFDLTHQINMTGYREPGFLWKLGLPFVWGPVGGTVNVPLRFAATFGPGAFCYHLAKTVVNNLQLRYHPRVRQALRRADGFITSNSVERRNFLRIWGKDSTVIPDSGPPRGTLPVRRRPAGAALRMAWSGIHVSRKALPLVLHAVARLPSTLPWHLDIVGEGPMTRRWTRLAGRLGVGPRCTWHGWVSTARAREIVAGADVLAFLSLHEGMPTVVMEALAMGVPVVCLDTCGQGDIVDSSCGIKIPVTSPGEVIARTASSLGTLAGDRALIATLRAGCHQRIAAVSWEHKVRRMNEVFYQAVGCR
jgi:glycosyltransferase involved in cell wall biosynthesis